MADMVGVHDDAGQWIGDFDAEGLRDYPRFRVPVPSDTAALFLPDDTLAPHGIPVVEFCWLRRDAVRVTQNRDMLPKLDRFYDERRYLDIEIAEIRREAEAASMRAAMWRERATQVPGNSWAWAAADAGANAARSEAASLGRAIAALEERRSDTSAAFAIDCRRWPRAAAALLPRILGEF